MHPTEEQIRSHQERIQAVLASRTPKTGGPGGKYRPVNIGGKVFPSHQLAAASLGCNPSEISHALNRGHKVRGKTVTPADAKPDDRLEIEALEKAIVRRYADRDRTNRAIARRRADQDRTTREIVQLEQRLRDRGVIK